MIVILILLLVILLFFEYNYFNKEICAAPVLFTAPFIVMCAVALFCSCTWEFDMHFNTFLVILMGNLFFFLGTIFANKIKIISIGTNSNVEQDRDDSSAKYFFFLLLQCVCYLWKIQLIMQFARKNGNGGDLSAALAFYDNAAKFTTKETIQWSSVLSLGLDICTAFGYVCACVLAQIIVQKNNHRKNLIPVLLNYCVAILGGLSSGGRGLAIRYIIAFLVAFLIMYFRQRNWKSELQFKYVFRILIILIFAIAFFVYSRQMVGRGAVSEVGQYLAKYIGAQLYNLDYYLNEAFYQSEIFGQETFHPIVQFICSKLGISRWSHYLLDLPFRQAAGYDMGNVHTTFYPYIHDFGYIGVLFMSLLCGFVAQLIYRFARYSPTKHTVHLGLVVYADVAYSIIFSFFSNKFGDLVFSISMLKKVVYMWLIILFLFHVRFDDRSITIDRSLNRKRKFAFGIKPKGSG